METRSQQDEERANILEVQVDEAKVIAEEADRKYEEKIEMTCTCLLCKFSARKALENRVDVDHDRCVELEQKLREAQALLAETESKSDEVDNCFVFFHSIWRVRKVMENRSFQDEERANTVESQLKEAQMLAEEADRKYDEVARKLAMVEADLERAEERAEAGENKIVELEEELRVVGNNLKSLEVSEEKALQREDSYEEQIRTVSARLKEAETRAEFAERSVQKLQKEVDRLEDELLVEKERVRNLTEEIEQTVQEIQGS
ncbi:unnamed protein product [Toxocara canis]|uniref:Tropomyosin n=1 Tax=Toxocara canis TaxID=6265 RepID=A0A183V4N3_TOXCA|nr:unnamed protein product [Toxocara canis]